MAVYEFIPRERNGDYAIRLTDASLVPYFSPGETVYLRRSTQLDNGDVGLFYADEGMVFRQFCADSEGNIYLLCLDRSRSADDLRIPAAGEKPVCYGKLVLKKPIPLPMD